MSYPNRTLPKSQSLQRKRRHHGFSVHWLFRSNIPRKRNSYLSADVSKRNFFGMGEIVSVLTNPAETLRSLTESRRLLEEARREISENRERAQLRPKHTFTRLPGFFPRPQEARAIERALDAEPSFTVVFGATSVGKTALLRQVLSNEKYHVLHFDLRIPGFADLPSFYISLSQQMEQYFEEIAKQMPGYEEFEKEAWAFKHDRINVEKRIAESTYDVAVRTSDIARLMELFQSSLLKYWSFEPQYIEDTIKPSGNSTRDSGGHQNQTGISDENPDRNGKPLRKWWKVLRSKTNIKPGAGQEGKAKEDEREKTEDRTRHGGEKARSGERKKKKIPVVFFDEAHKLPILLPPSAYTAALKCLLDSLVVLTKQDRLCHVLHATSDPFYWVWLQEMNVGGSGEGGCKLLTITDPSKTAMHSFFHSQLVPAVPERLRPALLALGFDKLYEAFGGRMAHWSDFIAEWVNSGGTLDIKQSSHFLQAHALLNLAIIHSSQSPFSSTAHQQEEDVLDQHTAAGVGMHPRSPAGGESMHPALGQAAAGRRNNLPYPYHCPPCAYSYAFPPARPPAYPLPPHYAHAPCPSSLTLGPHSDATHGLGGGPGLGMGGNGSPGYGYGGYLVPEYSAMQLLKVMSRLTSGNAGGSMSSTAAIQAVDGEDGGCLPYFLLCREMGVRAVDGMVKGRVLDLRWTDGVRRGGAGGASGGITGANSLGGTSVPGGPGVSMPSTSGQVQPQQRVDVNNGNTASQHGHGATGSSGTAVEAMRVSSEPEPDLIDISEGEDAGLQSQGTFHNTYAVPAYPGGYSGIQGADPYGHGPSNAHMLYEDEDGFYEGGRDGDYVDVVIGPKLLPVTPVMRYAMREVVREYEDEQSVSEYASMVTVDEY